MLKICLLGPPLSGKSLYINNLKEDLSPQRKNQSGVHFFRHDAVIIKKSYQIHYWSICGRRSYTTLAKTFAKSSNAILIFFCPKQNNLKDFDIWAKCIPDQVKNVYIIANILKGEKIPIELIKYKEKFGWKIRSVNLQDKKQSLALQQFLISENKKLMKLQNFGFGIINFEDNKSVKIASFSVVLAAIGFSLLLYHKLK